MISQLSNCRLLINHPLIFSPSLIKPLNIQTLRPFSFFTVFSSLPKNQRNLPSSPAKSLKVKVRNNSSLTEKNKSEKGSKMAEIDSTGFNKRRAEGKDKADKPKNLQRKVRKLNPVNTICYVQVCKVLKFDFLRFFSLIVIFRFLCIWYVILLFEQLYKCRVYINVALSLMGYYSPYLFFY